jgi:hypothetical protein
MTAASTAALGATNPTQFFLQVAALVTGGGLVQLLIFLLRRRSDLSALDRTSSKPLLEEQGAFVDRLVASETKAQTRIDALEAQRDADSKDFAERVRLVTRENKRLSAEVARVRVDLDIALGQVEELRRQLRLGGP